jgi:WhiB family redox-sensing transcriptional regulator
MARLDWKQQAACRDLDTALFFTDDDETVSRAKEVCATCPVREACLEFALATRQHDGVWGGLDEAERKRLRRRRAAGRTTRAA